MKKLSILFYLFCLLILFSCNENELLTPEDLFFSDVKTNATIEQLKGRWAIFQIEFEGELSAVPANIVECGRDFFEFQIENQYREFIFDDNFECTPQTNMLTWELSDGIIDLSNGIEDDQFVITKLTSSQLNFKFRLDIDEDGTLEIFKAICTRYEPPMELDIYSSTFRRITSGESRNKILFNWDSYKGYNDFSKYEIYRLDEDCNLNNSELIATITDINQTTFEDINPPALEEICYQFKLYTDKGLLTETKEYVISTSSIEVDKVNLAEPEVIGSNVTLNWEKYQGTFFSHYEIEVRNYSSGSGAGYQKSVIAKIDDIKTTTFSTELPFVENPTYIIFAYNIFGKKSYYKIEGENQRTTIFSRDEILPIDRINHFAFSPNETVVYYTNNSNLYAYDYASKTVLNFTNINSSSITFLKVFKSSFGTEIIINTTSSTKVYNPDLTFKYDLERSTFSLENLEFTNEGFWVSTDRSKLYSYRRINNKLELIDTNNLYKKTFSSSRINLKYLGQNRVLAGNANEGKGLIIAILNDGTLSDDSVPVDLNATSVWKNDSAFSPDQNYLLNFEDKTIFSTQDYKLKFTLNLSFFPMNISRNGSLILGTKNDPNPFGQDKFHEKKVRVLQYPNLKEHIYEAKGYPLALYENHLGQIISISRGFIGTLERSSPERDIFLEIIK